MTYKFEGAFTDEERRRITDALKEVAGRDDVRPGLSWLIFRREIKGAHQLFLAVDSRTGDGRCCSHYGKGLDELIVAIRAQKAIKAAD